MPSRSLKQPSFWDSQTPILIAHRGGDAAGVNKENTLAAFASAQELGYRYGETDVVLSKDRQVVAFHGSRNRLHSLMKKHRLSRSAVQRMTYARIVELINLGGEKAPLLEEVMAAQPGMKLFIDPKTEEVVEPLAELLKRLRVQDKICVNSFNYKRLQRLIGLLKPHKVAAAVIVGRGFRLRNQNLQLLKQGRLENVSGVHLHHSHVSKAMVDLAHAQGLKVLVWTANTPLSITNALNSGADGIISDNIRLLKQLAETRN